MELISAMAPLLPHFLCELPEKASLPVSLSYEILKYHCRDSRQAPWLTQTHCKCKCILKDLCGVSKVTSVR